MREISKYLQRWLEIDLDKLAANFAAVQGRLARDVGIIAVVKHNAYGFGAVECARLFVECGAQMLAVTSLEEALELRQAGILAPILVFLPPAAGQAEIFARYDLTATVDGVAAVEALRGTDVGCHLKLNTGMNRFGAVEADLAAILTALKQPEAPRLCGLYSHLATAPEKDDRFSRRQIAEFMHMRSIVLDNLQVVPENLCCHLANSAGMLRFAELNVSPFAAVRVGSALYGQAPIANELGVALAEPFAARARIVAVREVASGQGLGYGQEFTAKKALRVAVVPLGYGDGFNISADARELTVGRSLKTAGRDVARLIAGRYRRGVWFDGHFLPALGRIAMQTMLVDASSVDVKVGDVVNVAMRRTAASARLPRVYLRGGEVVAVDGFGLLDE